MNNTVSADVGDRESTCSKVSMVVSGKRLTINTARMPKEDVDTLMMMSEQNEDGVGVNVDSILQTKKSEVAAVKETIKLKKMLCVLGMWTVLLGLILFGTVILAIFLTKDMKPEANGNLITNDGHVVGTARAQTNVDWQDMLDPNKVPDEILQTVQHYGYDKENGYKWFSIESMERKVNPSGNELVVKGKDIEVSITPQGMQVSEPYVPRHGRKPLPANGSGRRLTHEGQCNHRLRGTSFDDEHHERDWDKIMAYCFGSHFDDGHREGSSCMACQRLICEIANGEANNCRQMIHCYDDDAHELHGNTWCKRYVSHDGGKIITHRNGAPGFSINSITKSSYDSQHAGHTKAAYRR